MDLRNSPLLILALVVCAALSACKVQISAKPKNIDYTKTSTISIAMFYNDSNNGPPDISQTFTESIKDYYLNNSKLQLANNNADLKLDGNIVKYTIRPIAPTSSNNQELAAKSRITITVKTNYTNTTAEDLSFTGQSFTASQDYDNTQSLSDVEEELIDEIFDQIILKIFTKSFDNW